MATGASRQSRVCLLWYPDDTISAPSRHTLPHEIEPSLRLHAQGMAMEYGSGQMSLEKAPCNLPQATVVAHYVYIRVDDMFHVPNGIRSVPTLLL